MEVLFRNYTRKLHLGYMFVVAMTTMFFLFEFALLIELSSLAKKFKTTQFCSNEFYVSNDAITMSIRNLQAQAT